MKALILSDIHNEFGEFVPTPVDCDVVILAGDIDVKLKAIPWAAKYFSSVPVLYVPGNHEFYGASYPSLITKLKNLSEDFNNVHILHKEIKTIDGVNFFGAILWADFEPFGNPKVAGYHAQQNMSDFEKVRIEPRYSRMRSLDASIMHTDQRNWLDAALAEHKNEVNIVISHHAPSHKSIASIYKEDLLSAAYASNLEDLILTRKPVAWIHGHCHNTSNYLVGETRVICNPRGYYPDNLNPDFNPEFILDLSLKELRLKALAELSELDQELGFYD